MDNHFEETFLPLASIGSGMGRSYFLDLYVYLNRIVNCIFIGKQNEKDWVLIDAGMPNSAPLIREEAMERFGDIPPKAIVLTHGHFDHVGSLVDLLEMWDVPVYAHEKELPFLNGKRDYPKGDPTVDGGLVAELSPFFPNHGINLGDNLHSLPSDGTIPGLPNWRWLSTPGHTPGHVSLFREEDKALIAGDAFVTVKQESLYKVIVQDQEISGPPKYFTSDWKAAKQSVLELAALKPNLAITGHGIPMFGSELTEALENLCTHFEEIALPENLH